MLIRFKVILQLYRFFYIILYVLYQCKDFILPYCTHTLKANYEK